MSYPKDVRERAKADGKHMFRISLSPEYLSADARQRYSGQTLTTTSFDIVGPLGAEQAVELWKLCRKWQNEKKV